MTELLHFLILWDLRIFPIYMGTSYILRVMHVLQVSNFISFLDFHKNSWTGSTQQRIRRTPLLKCAMDASYGDSTNESAGKLCAFLSYFRILFDWRCVVKLLIFDGNEWLLILSFSVWWIFTPKEMTLVGITVTVVVVCLRWWMNDDYSFCWHVGKIKPSYWNLFDYWIKMNSSLQFVPIVIYWVYFSRSVINA